ncbi:TetR/AcrR family transcriptional regulator [Desulfatiferula olefinivorans]
MTDRTLKKTDRTRALIIEKAAPVFNRKGLAGTTLSDLTCATGLTKGSIYGNFKDKDDVALHVFEYHCKALSSFLTKAVDREATAVGKLLAIPEAYRRLYPRILAHGGCPILNTATEADDTHEALRRKAVETIDTIRQQILDLIHAGINSGELREKTDPADMADTVITLVEGGLFLSKLTGEARYILTALSRIDALIHSARTRREPFTEKGNTP